MSEVIFVYPRKLSIAFGWGHKWRQCRSSTIQMLVFKRHSQTAAESFANMSYLSSHSVIVSLNRYTGLITVSMKVHSTLWLRTCGELSVLLSIRSWSFAERSIYRKPVLWHRRNSFLVWRDATPGTLLTSRLISLFFSVQLERAFFLSKDQAPLSLCPARQRSS